MTQRWGTPVDTHCFFIARAVILDPRHKAHKASDDGCCDASRTADRRPVHTVASDARIDGHIPEIGLTTQQPFDGAH